MVMEFQELSFLGVCFSVQQKFIVLDSLGKGSSKWKWLNNTLHIFPNPTDGIVNIEILKNIEGEINLINTFGKKIINININESNEDIKRIDLSDLSKGIYIIQLINNNDIINHRIILQQIQNKFVKTTVQ